MPRQARHTLEMVSLPDLRTVSALVPTLKPRQPSHHATKAHRSRNRDPARGSAIVLKRPRKYIQKRRRRVFRSSKIGPDCPDSPQVPIAACLSSRASPPSRPSRSPQHQNSVCFLFSFSTTSQPKSDQPEPQKRNRRVARTRHRSRGPALRRDWQAAHRAIRSARTVPLGPDS